MEFQIERKGLKLEAHVDETVPASLLLDAKRYKQVVFNLVGNAVKFTMKGIISIKVWFENSTLLTEVRDTGVGIHEGQKNKLFKVFGKLSDPAKLNKQGIGMGLAICKLIVEK